MFGAEFQEAPVPRCLEGRPCDTPNSAAGRAWSWFEMTADVCPWEGLRENTNLHLHLVPRA